MWFRESEIVEEWEHYVADCEDCHFPVHHLPDTTPPAEEEPNEAPGGGRSHIVLVADSHLWFGWLCFWCVASSGTRGLLLSARRFRRPHSPWRFGSPASDQVVSTHLDLKRTNALLFQRAAPVPGEGSIIGPPFRYIVFFSVSQMGSFCKIPLSTAKKCWGARGAPGGTDVSLYVLWNCFNCHRWAFSHLTRFLIRSMKKCFWETMIKLFGRVISHKTVNPET